MRAACMHAWPQEVDPTVVETLEDLLGDVAADVGGPSCQPADPVTQVCLLLLDCACAMYVLG